MFMKRFLIVFRLLKLNDKEVLPIKIVIPICLCMGIFWASLPILGWSNYKFEAFGLSCSMERNEKSFNTTILVFVFFIPLVLIVISTLMSIIMVKK